MKEEPVIGIQKHLIPQPYFSVAIFVVWLIANESLSVGTLASGVAWALILPLFTARFWPDAPKVRRWRPLLLLLVVFLRDIAVANFQVARLVLGPVSRLHPAWFEVPLDLTHPFSLSLLSATVSLTPGTISANLCGDRKVLLVHALYAPNPEAEIALIKARYESLILEAFEC